MTSQLSAPGSCETQGARSVRQMRQLVGLLFHNSANSTATARSFGCHQPTSATVPPQPSSRHSEKYSKNVCAHKNSVASTISSEADSAVASRNDESETGSCLDTALHRRRSGQSSLDFKLSMETQQCSVTEKVQRWKETMGKKWGGKSKSSKLERLGSSSESSRHCTKLEDGSRDSLDSGLNSLSALDVEAHRESLNVLNSRIGSASPLNGEHDVDDTLTSVMSSIASDFEIDVSDLEEHEDRPDRGRSSAAGSSFKRGGSASSFSSGGDEDQDARTLRSTDEIVAFMETYVDNIFDNYELISQIDKAKFGALARTAQGRDAFARALNAKRVGNQRVGEGAFLSLNQSMAVILFECNEAHDWSPAKVLMNMCLTFYIENDDSQREHLYTHLAPQKIWKSLTFWNSAFFEAILLERAKFNLPTTTVDGVMQIPDRESQRECLEKITFSQLATFTHNMHAFGLPLELCLEFLEKQVVIGNLPAEQEEMLQENIERLYNQQSP